MPVDEHDKPVPVVEMRPPLPSTTARTKMKLDAWTDWFIVACAATVDGARQAPPGVDCWRILPDGARWLLERVGLKILECRAGKLDTIRRRQKV